ncbi:hypothetical protein [Streptomyces atratus]|uniref:hypothetical protein n=1 Tax=Streptomyces atratus TaxID=1893 RepID=UPI00225A2D7E|nr:hypothetical protein [Streptomyces atratus]MCX5339749.1 hypothetical protein [Streptomyces atratus]
MRAVSHLRTRGRKFPARPETAAQLCAGHGSPALREKLSSGRGHRDPAYWINRDGCVAEQLWLDAQEGRGEPFADSWVDRGLLEDLVKESETTRAAMTKLAMDVSLAGPTEVADAAASAMDAAHAMLVHLTDLVGVALTRVDLP